ncbi:MAG: CoA transferase [Pseudomonadales bacterium]|nr:CoA transferase [Pseudomonadales bacterium]
MAGALEGIRIIDLTTIYSGPICTSILGDQGADVIKVESPDGDWIRSIQNIQRNGVNGAFAMMNRNKRSAMINLSTEEGKDVLRRLVKDADVLVENYRPGVMDRLGLGYEALKAINPKLVYAAINGVGAEGPYANRRIYDAIIQAVSGMGALQANPKEEKPVLVNTLICDKLTSWSAAQSITAALVARGRTGEGQRIDIAMLDTALYFLWSDSLLNYTFVGDDVPYAEPLSHEVFVRQTKDGYICTMPVQLDEWMDLFKALDLPNLLEDPAYLTADGVDNEKMGARLNEAILLFATDDLAIRMEANQVPYAKINAREDVIHDPQVVAMNSIWEFDHMWAGPMRQARPPARFSETPSEIFRDSPEHGQHTSDVLTEAGYDADTIKALRERGVVGG